MTAMVAIEPVHFGNRYFARGAVIDDTLIPAWALPCFVTSTGQSLELLPRTRHDLYGAVIAQTIAARNP